MHILLAPDSFKESLSAVQVAEALKEGFSQALPEA
ncbi:glycerate kinase, partial [Streptococcus cristatus]